MGYLSIGTKFELIFGQEELTLFSPHHTRSGRVYTGAYSVFQPDAKLRFDSFTWKGETAQEGDAASESL